MSFRLLHMPIRPPRQGHISERVYCSRWIDLMNTPLAEEEQEDGMEPPCRLSHNVLPEIRAYRRIRQRDARVAASMVSWLGTNVGLSVLIDAKKIRDSAPHWARGKAYHMAWALENTRNRCLSGGWKISEYLLAPADHFQKGELMQMPNYTWQDEEVLAHTFAWVGTLEGSEFVDSCNKQITAERTGKKAAI
jgi:hypothetical protein